MGRLKAEVRHTSCAEGLSGHLGPQGLFSGGALSVVIKWQPLAPSIEMAATSLCCQDQGLSVTSHDTELLILLKYTLFNKKMLSGFPGHVCMLSHFSSVQLLGPYGL